MHFALALSLGLFVAAGPHRATNAELGFSFEVPEGYTGQTDTFPITLTHGELSQPGGAVVTIQALPAPIGRRALNHDEVEKAARDSSAGTGVTLEGFTYETMKWGPFEVDRVITSMSNPAGMKVIVFATQVPLKKKGIQVQLAGLEAERAALQAQHQALIDSIQGESSWLTDHERGERLGRIIGTVTGFACCSLVPVALVVWLVWRRRTPAASTKRGSP